MPSRDAGLALPGVPQGECGNRGRQAVPLHLAQLDHDVGAGLVPTLPVGSADFGAPIRDAPTPFGSAGMSTSWRSRDQSAMAILAMLGHGQDARGTKAARHPFEIGSK